MATALAGLAWAAACGDGATEPPPPDPPRPATVTVTPANVQLTALGATVQLAADVRDQHGQGMPGATVTWSSSTAAVATVDASGLVTAVGNGTATITAAVGGASGTTAATVTQSPDSVVVLPAKAAFTALGDTLRLGAEAFDANGHAVAGAEFAWESSDDAVATVDASGLVTAAGIGTARVTATAGGASGAATVTVTEPGILFGTVSDSRKAGLAIPGATVQVENGTTMSMTTDSLGRFQFSGISGERVTVTGSAPRSYQSLTVEVAADSGPLDIKLEHTGISPFFGTVWVTPELLGPDDPTSFSSVTHTGRGAREIFDRRSNTWITVNAYLFDVQFGEKTVEWQFNPEFGSEKAARAEIDVFAPAIGRLPAALLTNFQEVEVNAGEGAFGGNSYNGSFLIHTEDPGTRHAVQEGFLEEVFLHEGAHMSLDPDHADSPGWRAAQQADIVAISEYARDFPDREDVAETFLTYFAVRYLPERLTAPLRWLMTMTTPNRLAYLDEQELDMSPYTVPAAEVVVYPAIWTPSAEGDSLRFEDPPIPPRRNRR